jgi:hypothetical protein
LSFKPFADSVTLLTVAADFGNDSGLTCDGYRTDTAARIADTTPMPRYSFTLEDCVPIAPEDVTEDFANNQAAMDHANLIAKDLARSKAARDHLRVVVRNEAGKEIGDVPLQVDLR